MGQAMPLLECTHSAPLRASSGRSGQQRGDQRIGGRRGASANSGICASGAGPFSGQPDGFVVRIMIVRVHSTSSPGFSGRPDRTGPDGGGVRCQAHVLEATPQVPRDLGLDCAARCAHASSNSPRSITRNGWRRSRAGRFRSLPAPGPVTGDEEAAKSACTPGPARTARAPFPVGKVRRAGGSAASAEKQSPGSSQWRRAPWGGKETASGKAHVDHFRRLGGTAIQSSNAHASGRRTPGAGFLSVGVTADP